MTTASFKTVDGAHFLCAEGGGGREVNATRTSAGPWEAFEVIRVDGGVAFKANNGQYMCAEQGGGGALNANRDAIGAWETFTLVPMGNDGAVALRSINGHFICSEQGGGGEVNVTRTEANEWETFMPSVPLDGGVEPPPPTGLDRIDGQLQIEAAGGYVVNGRPVLPTLCHYGDALSKWMRDRGHVERNLDLIAGAGYHGIRYWTVLDGDWWNGRHVGERFQPDYWDQHAAFLRSLKARGLVAQISQGSLTPDAVPDRHGFAHRMADVLVDVGPEVCALFEAVNEARDTGEPDARRLAEFVGVFHARLSQVLCALSAYTGTEDVAILDDFSRAPADLFVVHPYRGGHNHDKTRHLMSLIYEIKPKKRHGWNGEGPGPGHRVSAIDNRDAMTSATMCGLAAMSFMVRMAYVYFCGVGVISDDGGSQTFDQMPGFFDVPKVRTLVPADVMRYSGPLFHGGETWRNDRTFAARGDVRADHVVHHDGRRVIGIYGPGDLNVPQERPFAADIDHRFGDEFRLVVGRDA